MSPYRFIPALALALALPRVASAQSWRRQAPRDETRHVSVDLRFGGYYPRVDEEFGGGSGGPFQRVFCRNADLSTTCPPQFLMGLGIDWLPLRIPYVGAFGPGVNWGFTTMRAPASVASSGELTETNTFLNIMPLGAVATLRLDELFIRTGFPFVPYAKGGFASAYWWTGTEAGNSSSGTGADAVPGDGWSFGYQVSVGGAIALDWIDRESMARLAASTGFRHIYVFGEFWTVDVGSFGGKQMRVGTNSWVLGVNVEM